MSEIYIDIEKWLRRPPVILPGCSPIVAMKAMVSHWDRIDRIEKIKKNREGLTVNYEYLKGSKKDFEGSNDGVMRIYRSDSGSFLYADIDTFDARWELIAERRPITERELKPIYGDGIHDDTEALQQRIDMGIDVSNIIGEQGKLFNISRPLQFKPITEPAWDGEGLPPVGVECEMENDRGTWLPVDVIAHKDGFAFGWSYDYRMVLHSDKPEGFRHIRSTEDVARDEAIEAMRDVVLASDQSLTCYESLYNAIAAGKIPGVKLE
ncbi:hypothetical protein [Rahnella variigena]|uniref:hypothetical protein n=1 Tax=Rahnella variigena TaxID=574964 RepID=UPI0028DD0EF4|nr:hypothetical protein [Rahnella variigena]